MKQWWRGWRAFLGAYPEPPKKLTVREAVASAVVYAVFLCGVGLITGWWTYVIGGGLSGAGGNLLYRWWFCHTDRPEHEDEVSE
ncbi:hypothetical protein [Streptomyces sp. NPDC102360]|uniref:hypothetical protein n=1 Tax=Streptomyces sp. NPDC102360 TaxID=3366160 RepID=UPI0037FDEF2E